MKISLINMIQLCLKYHIYFWICAVLKIAQNQI